MRSAEFDLHYSEYPAAVAAAGGLPVELASDADADDLLSRLDGLVLTGGTDIDPSLYGCAPSPELGEVDLDRDLWELALLRAALAQGVPVLGICRGAQLLNVGLGGTLTQHVELDEGAGHPRFDGDRSELAHHVRMQPGSVAASVFGAQLDVNSLHHQTLDLLGDGLTASGHAADGVIEVIELTGRPVLAVQWHPEMLTQPDPAIAWLITAAALFAGDR
jgi:putative glutamine amidotransferase